MPFDSRCDTAEFNPLLIDFHVPEAWTLAVFLHLGACFSILGIKNTTFSDVSGKDSLLTLAQR